MKRSLTLMAGSMLMLSASSAFADPNFIDTTRSNANALSGSDTVNKVMDDLITALRGSGQLSTTGSGGIQTYLGCGSSCGQRQLEGSPNTAEQGAGNNCTPLDGNNAPEANPGCQEISPMSRQLTNSICEDDPNHPATANTEAEGLAFCADGLAIVSNNDSLGAFGADAAACAAAFTGPGAPVATPNDGNVFNDRGVGRLRKSGVLASGYAIADWKDVLRLVYTGCKNTDGTCADATDRVTRCGAAVRQELVGSWANLFEGVACANSSGCPTGLRHAYRRDDASGTTGVFLALLGVNDVVGTNIASRASVVSGLGPAAQITPIPAKLAYCDGGDIEGNLPTGLTAAGAPLYTGGDPIRTTCAVEDDLCGTDGKIALVRGIKSTDSAPAGLAFPAHQCKRKFEYVAFMSTAFPVCPDGLKPSGGRCKFPFFESGAFKTFNCMNRKAAGNPSAAPGSDGRAYNYVVHAQDGTVSYLDGAAKKLPVVAQWRQNMVKIDQGALVDGKVYAPSDVVCQEADATRTIGCLSANTKCTLGMAGREAAFNNSQPSIHPLQDAAIVNGSAPTDVAINDTSYKLSRFLFVNATRGFENMMIDCKNRGGSKAYCEDQARIANEFFNVGAPGNLMAGICSNAGFVPLAQAQCIGAVGAATCGKPTSQPLSACAVDTSSYDALANNNP